MRTVSEIPSNGVCVGCGACAANCDEHAIRMGQDHATGLFTPAVDFLACSGCGKCLMVCPAVKWTNITQSNLSHHVLGGYVQAYSAFASENKLRVDAASGGFVTALLQSMLKNGNIDGAVVSRRVKGEPLRSETILARTLDEIASCKGSVYSPVCFSEVFEQLNRVPEGERWAIVGLPCHIQALSLMTAHNSSLAKKVFLTISLVCGHVPTHRAYRYSLKRMGLDESEIVDINNRGDGWPGFLRIELKDGSIKRVPYGDALSWGMVFSSPLFTSTACHVCPDPGGFAADIMVCDAWLPRYMVNQDGVNLVLAKTPRGNKMVQRAQSCGDFNLEDCRVDDFIAANKRVFVAKTRNHSIAMRCLVGRNAGLFHRNIQEYGSAVKLGVRFKLWCYYSHVRLAKSLRLDRVVAFLPKAFLFYWKVIGLLKR